MKGKVGLTANIPARFREFRVSASERVKQHIDARIMKREAEVARLALTRRGCSLPPAVAGWLSGFVELNCVTRSKINNHEAGARDRRPVFPP